MKRIISSPSRVATVAVALILLATGNRPLSAQDDRPLVFDVELRFDETRKNWFIEDVQGLGRQPGGFRPGTVLREGPPYFLDGGATNLVVLGGPPENATVAPPPGIAIHTPATIQRRRNAPPTTPIHLWIRRQPNRRRFMPFLSWVKKRPPALRRSISIPRSRAPRRPP